ncbi:MAG: hypothetical protein GF364_19560 [Candidatus Lokiarchaeota archaeon]|nr:hypothetical protein [Candidatus Lokiarchaeota archaeon]
MIERMIIFNKGGLPLYTRKFVESGSMEPSLLAGLVSAIDSMGFTLFKKKIATISFGEENFSSLNENVSKIVFISKDIMRLDKNFYFVFFCNGNDSLKLLRQISTRVFIEIKSILQSDMPDSARITELTNKIINNHFAHIGKGDYNDD